MHLSTALLPLLALLPFATAQAANCATLVPSCGQSCLASAQSAAGCTASDDYACACSKSAEIQNNPDITSCVVQACGAQTGLAVQSGAKELCSCVATAPARVAARATQA